MILLYWSSQIKSKCTKNSFETCVVHSYHTFLEHQSQGIQKSFLIYKNKKILRKMSRKNKEAKWQLLSKSGIFPTNQDSVWQLNNNVDITTITSYNNVNVMISLSVPIQIACFQRYPL
jgi:hypothetical protein